MSVCEGVYMSGVAYGECKATEVCVGGGLQREREAARVSKVSGCACAGIRVLKS